MTMDSRIRDQTRRAAVSAIRRGRLTAAEVADLAGTSRQLVHYWCTVARVDPVRARRRYLAAEWTEAMAGYVKRA